MVDATLVISGENRSDKAFRSANSSIKRLVKNVGGLALAYGALRVTTKVIDIHRKFTATISDLSAITGATGKQLEFLRKKSLQYGETTTLTASQAAEAFKLVASAKPDLLENAAALAAVTKQSIILAEASGSTLPEAAITLTLAMNQYGASADQAARFINVLAAGAKFGASEIAATAAALKNSGLVARSAGTSFEELNAIIQVLAKSGIKAEEAGVGIRNIFLNLAIQTNDKFKPSVVGFTQAIKNMKAANLSTTELLAIFGKKNIVAAKAVIQHADALGTLTKKLTGTNTALDQANTKVDNLDGDIKKMNSAWEGVSLTLGKLFNPILRAATKLLTWMSKIIKVIIISFDAVSDSVGAFAAQLGALAEGEFGRIAQIRKDRNERRAAHLERMKNLFTEKKAVEDLNIAKTGGDKGKESGAVAGAAGAPAGGLTAKDNKIIESLKLRIATARDIEIAAHISRQEALTELNALGILSDAEFDARIENEQRRHEARLTQIKIQAAKQRSQAERKWSMQTAKTALGMLAMSSAATASHNKKMFKLNKMASIGQAVISTYEGVANALKLPFPLNFAVAAMVAYAGLQNVKAIKSAKFGGGGSAPSLGGSSVTPTSTAPNPSNFASGSPGQQQQQAPNRNVMVIVEGDGMVSQEWIREQFIPGLNEAIGDGVTIDVVTR